MSSSLLNRFFGRSQEQPRSSLDEVTRELFRRAGIKVSTVTARKALREAGIERLKPVRRAGERAAVQGTAPTRDGQRGAPPRYERRHMVNACCHALRTGCPWRLLPETFPPWQAT